MFSQRLDNAMTFLFKRIFSLNKIDFTSLIFSILLLITKCLLGTFTIISIFFANQTAFYSITPFISSLLIIHNSQKNTASLVTCISLSGVNILIGLLFMNFSTAKLIRIANNLLLVIFILLQNFKYVLGVLICSQIREEISNGKLLFGVINSINFVLLLFWILFFEKFYFTLNYSTKNLLARFNLQIHDNIECLCVMITIVMALIGAENLNKPLQIAFNLAFLVMKSVFIYKGLLKWLYVKRIIQEIYAFFFVLQTVTLFANLIIQLTNQNLLKSNFFVSIFVTSLFCFLGWKSYFDWNREDIYFARGKDIKETSKAVAYLKAMHDVVSQNASSGENTQLILASIKKQHEIQCKNLSCYCRSHDENLFLREYSIQQLQQMRQTFKGTPKILIQELNFRFYIFNAYPDVLNRLQHIKENYPMSLTEKYSYLTLKTELINFIDKKNRTFGIIDIESPLKLEEVTKKIQNIIKKDIEKKNKKWKYLSRGLCRIEELQQDTNLQISNLKEITGTEAHEMKNFKRSILFNILILFYYKKVSFLHMKNDEIHKNLIDQFRKVKQEEISSSKQFSKWIFHKRSCVIESLIDDENMGIISRSSKNVQEMFGYSRSKLIGMNMNKLMASFMAEEHNNILNNWLKTGTWRTVGKLKEIFCIHKDELCFSGLIYLKMMANQNGLFFVGVIFKKNESDYMVLNQKHQIEGIGRKFVNLFGQNCRKIPIQLLCADFPTLDISKQDEFKYFVKEFISLTGQNGLAELYLEQKNRLFLSEDQQEKFLKNYQSKIQERKVEKWQVKFGLKIYRMRDVSFFVVLLSYAKKIQTLDGLTISRISEKKIEIFVGTGKVNQNEDMDTESEIAPSNMTIDEGHQQFFEQKNSSMVSSAERQNFTLSKLLKVFYEFLIHPLDIRNGRIDTLNISTLLQTLILTAIISVSFFIYMSSLNEIKSYVSASIDINQRMQLAISMYNKVVSFEEYRTDPQTMDMFLEMTANDLRDFHLTLAEHVEYINIATSELHSEQLYQYLKSPIMYFSGNGNKIEIEVLQFMTYYDYLTSSIKNAIVKDRNIDIIKVKEYEMNRIRENFPQLKEISASISRTFRQMTETTKSRLIVIAWTVMAIFLVITFLFFLYSYNYFSFRFQQKNDCLEIYKTIPPPLIDRVKDYYAGFFYVLFLDKGTKDAGIEDNLEVLNESDLNVQDIGSSSISGNKIKFIGRQKFTGWIRSFLMFLAINTVNIMITYEIVSFVSPLGSFMTSVTKIIDAQNKQFSSYLDIKGLYFLSHESTLNVTQVDNILGGVNQSDVEFNEMVMFESETLTLYDPEFYSDFHHILVENVCAEIREMVTEQEFNDCMTLSKKALIEQGIMTYMNFFQRKVRSALEDLKVNSTLRLTEQKRTYFLNRGFKEIDLCISYSIKLFRKLVERIIVGYRKGIEYISFINIVVLVILITPQILSLIFWFHLAKQEKAKLSLLYGSILMIPPNVIKQVKNLPRMAKKILEFQEC